MRRERRKTFFNPQTMLHLEYSLRTEKKTPQHKSTYTINTWLATGGTYPALASSHPVQCHLFRRRSTDLLALVAVQSVTEAVEWGRGVMSVVGGREEEIPTPSLSQGGYPDGLGQGASTGIYSDRLLPTFWLCLPFDILSVCCLPRPLHCPCCWFCLAYVTPVIASDPCLFDLALLFIKAAFGS